MRKGHSNWRVEWSRGVELGKHTLSKVRFSRGFMEEGERGKDQGRNTGWGQPGMAGNARLRSLGFITEARVQQSLRSG